MKFMPTLTRQRYKLTISTPDRDFTRIVEVPEEFINNPQEYLDDYWGTFIDDFIFFSEEELDS
jgi:hypothetical protein